MVVHHYGAISIASVAGAVPKWARNRRGARSQAVKHIVTVHPRHGASPAAICGSRPKSNGDGRMWVLNPGGPDRECDKCRTRAARDGYDPDTLDPIPSMHTVPSASEET